MVTAHTDAVRVHVYFTLETLRRAANVHPCSSQRADWSDADWRKTSDADPMASWKMYDMEDGHRARR